MTKSFARGRRPRLAGGRRPASARPPPQPFTVNADLLRRRLRRRRPAARRPGETRRLHAQSGGPRLSQAPEERMGRRQAAAQHRRAGPHRDATRRRLPADGVRPDRPRLGTALRATPAPTTRTGSTTYFPFLPPDFDEHYYQAAPADQQVPLPQGGRGGGAGQPHTGRRARSFTLPHFEVPVHVFPKKGEREDLHAQRSTPSSSSPTTSASRMTWRVARPLKKNMFEIAQVLVGKKGQEWWQQREQVAFPIPVGDGADAESRRRRQHARRMTAQPIAILGTGLVTCVGLTAPACCAAFRAKISNPTETRFIDSGGEWIMAHQVALEQPWRGLTKLAKMAAMAIDECLAAYPARAMAATAAAAVRGRAERPGRLGRAGRPAVRRDPAANWAFASRRHPPSSPHGRVGVAVALAQARAAD